MVVRQSNIQSLAVAVGGLFHPEHGFCRREGRG